MPPSRLLSEQPEVTIFQFFNFTKPRVDTKKREASIKAVCGRDESRLIRGLIRDKVSQFLSCVARRHEYETSRSKSPRAKRVLFTTNSRS